MLSPLLQSVSYAEEAAAPEEVTQEQQQSEGEPSGEAATEEEAEEETAAADESAPPTVPQNLSVVDGSVTATTATLKWETADGLADADIWYFVKEETKDEDINNYLASGKDGSVSLTNLQPNTTYKLYSTWYKRPFTRVERSNFVEFKTLDGTPTGSTGTAGATNLRAVEVTHNTAKIEFDPAHKTDHYWIWADPPIAGQDPYSGFTQVGGSVVGGLKPETTYSWIIGPNGVQYASLKPEQKSNRITFTTLADASEYEPAPLTPPQNLHIKSIVENKVTLSWTVSPGANGYDLYVNGGWGGGKYDGTDVMEITYTVPNTTAGTLYKFMVGAQAAAAGGPTETSEKSNIVSLKWGQLDAPQGLQVITSNSTTAALGWAPVAGAASYEIYQDGKLVGTSDTSRYSASGLKEGQTYSFTIKAKNSLWTSESSSTAIVVPGSNYTNVTYYISWAAYTSADSRNFQPEDMDVSQVTHINYAFADICWKKVGSNGRDCQVDKSEDAEELPYDIPLQDRYVHDGEMIVGDKMVDIQNFNKFAAIKEENPHLKLLVSVGGWTFSNHFSDMAASEETRRAFAASAVKFLRAYGLDGLDIDWEYPVEGGESDNIHRPEDNVNFTLLMKTVREALDAAGSEDGKYYLLTIASLQADSFIANADLPNSSKYLDFVNIMTYDFSGSWTKLAHHNSPLYYDPKHPGASAKRNNVRGGAVGHLNGGVEPHKLVLGVPYYGKGWIGCPEAGQYQECEAFADFGTWESGLFEYDDIEDNYLKNPKFQHYWNEASKVSYVYSKEDKLFIGYNDVTTMMYTASLVKTLNLAGVMSWDITNDENRTLTTQLVKDLPIDGKANEAALKAPQNAKKVSSSTNSFTVQWDAVEGASSYEIFNNYTYVKTITDTKISLTNLAANTEYTVTILAVKNADNKIAEVSPMSNPVKIKTAELTGTPVVTPPTGSGDTTTELDASITKNDGKWVINIQEGISVQTINGSKETAFKLSVDKEAKSIEVELPQSVVTALAAKGDNAQLSIVWNGVTYVIPAHALPLGVNLQISITPASASAAEAAEKLAKDSGLKLLAQPLDFKISKHTSDGKLEEITDFGKYSLSRIFTLAAADVNTANATGVVYDPTTNTFRPVPTLFTKLSNDKVTAELKRSGNSIYTIVQSSISYKDATAAWAKDAVARAAAKLLLAGESADTFGVSSSITRAEFTSMIVKGLGILPENGTAPFQDVAANSKYAGDIAAAKKLGLIQGKSETAFDPDSTISRQDIAVILTNVLSYLGVKTDADASKLNAFADAKDIAAYAKSAVALAVQEGIMIGKSSTTFDPKADLTKAQAAVIVIRILEAHKLDKV
ncbi:glycosyl hydrolase family 18 protein [Paenibacillus sp. NPDC057967]|uniref:glycosyl hydrolase family 18 protein n=1 Tax=Paenibacillus sp. NPDC057967 TaxID=3346293 RepID=UPI0036D7DA97